MKRALDRLPAGSKLLRRIDLMHNKRELRIVTALSLALALIMFAAMALVVSPAHILAPYRGRPLLGILPCAALLAYIPLHELTHGVLIRLFSGKRAVYGFNLAYASARSDMYFAKAPYLLIALAPVAVWGAALAALQALTPVEWAWSIYAVQMFNISGAAGDLYTTAVVARMPSGVLIRDYGASMNVYAPGASRPDPKTTSGE